MKEAVAGYRSPVGAMTGGAMLTAAVSGLDPRGSAAREIEFVWWVLLAAGAIALAVVAVAMIVGLARRSREAAPAPAERRRRADDRRDERRARSWIVAGGVVLPALSVGVVLVATIDAMASLDDEADADALVVEVIGHQWWWEVRYPDSGVVTANEVNIPAGVPVRLDLRSADVVHSFWVPELAGKLDLLPERVNRLVIDADRPGRYLGRCAEFCGVQHANMAVVVVAHDESGFRRWLDEQSAPAAEPQGEAAEGLRTFLDQGCATCHTIAGTPADGDEGPDLTHVASRELIAGGLLEPVVPDLTEWIEDPHAVKPGTKMPTTDLTPDQVDRLVTYLETLR